ncbi:MAG: TIGR01777 family oxidoreductase, partial [Verrucomicrobiota bacterium]
MNQLNDIRRVLISGGHGFLGSALKTRLASLGCETLVLTRSVRGAGDIRWNPAAREIEGEKLNGIDAVVHLAGESLTSGRWTKERKASFRSSRVEATDFLVEALGRCELPPKIFLCSSGIGVYGNSGYAICDESTGRGEGFLADLCVDWERAAMKAESFARRVVSLRTGVVLSPESGALKLMLPIFRKGLGGQIGDGKIWMSWIALEDWVEAVIFILGNELEGPVNLAAPEAVSNGAFTKALGKALGRPTVFPVPRFMLKGMYGSE